MTSSRRHVACALFALTWVVAQPGTLNALAWGHDGDGHAHGLSLERDAGHLDLVLTHDEGANCDRGNPEQGSWCPTSEHVVHLTGDPASGESARRHAPARAPLLATPLPASFTPARVLAPGRASSPHIRASEILRTTVLRL